MTNFENRLQFHYFGNSMPHRTMKGRSLKRDFLQKNNLEVFEELFRLYYPRLKSYAYSFLGSHDEANDVVQDVFYQLWEDQKLLNSERNISSFVFTLIRNRCLNILKHRIVEEKYIHHQVLSSSEELYHISFENSGHFVSMEELLYQELNRIIELMPAKCSRVFRMKWLDGKKNREIAEALQISMTMVDKHLARGMAIARENLTPGLLLFFVFHSKFEKTTC